MKRSCAVGLIYLQALLLSGCAVSAYQPEPVRHAVPLADDAFDVVLGILRDRYGRIEVADRDAFRLQTGWRAFQRGDVAGHRSATVFLETDGRLRILVQVRYLSIGSDGLPKVRGPYGDRPAEERLAGVIERAL